MVVRHEASEVLRVLLLPLHLYLLRLSQSIEPKHDFVIIHMELVIALPIIRVSSFESLSLVL